MLVSLFFFFNDTATTEIYTLSLHDALPISVPTRTSGSASWPGWCPRTSTIHPTPPSWPTTWPSCLRRTSGRGRSRSEEHTSELQSRQYLVCRLLLEKKKKNNKPSTHNYSKC